MRILSPGVDVVVCNYRTPGDLAAFIDHYDPEIPNTLHVSDVDPIEPYPIEESLNVRYFSHNFNLGYARAVNYAVARGNRETVAIFNADTELRPGVLEDLAEQIQLNDDWGAVGPRQVDGYGRITHAGIFGTLEQPAHRGWQSSDNFEYEDVRTDAVTISGSAYVIRREVWEEMTNCPFYKRTAPEAEGAFLPTNHYYEETYCSYHLHAHDYKVVYYGPACMIHQWHRASPVGGWAEQQMAESQATFRAACDLHGIAHN